MARKIQLDCENCKIELSSKESTILEVFDIDDDNGEPIEFECEITRAELESLIAATVERSIGIAKKALSGAGVTANQLDKILLVGGSTFIAANISSIISPANPLWPALCNLLSKQQSCE